MKLLTEGSSYESAIGGVEGVVPEDHYALVDKDSILLVLGTPEHIVTVLAGLLVGAGLETMAVTWRKSPTLDVSGKTVFL